MKRTELFQWAIQPGCLGCMQTHMLCCGHPTQAGVIQDQQPSCRQLLGHPTLCGGWQHPTGSLQRTRWMMEIHPTSTAMHQPGALTASRWNCTWPFMHCSSGVQQQLTRSKGRHPAGTPFVTHALTAGRWNCTRPLMVCSSDSGCSWISFCMKWSAPPCEAVPIEHG
eukprot:scaffold19125_cov17-Tisochrysis_lutea.AAC.2